MAKKSSDRTVFFGLGFDRFYYLEITFSSNYAGKLSSIAKLSPREIKPPFLRKVNLLFTLALDLVGHA